ncbi:barstar family protein [uncultured Tateyamaria sp.]|uniref:barstar family protein n=1 Tax=uncultured Tateyamaria sp. TaxID=455651 RepID=UPI0026017899|nr:barstar family protein [uncultured Tateyamaria sp.]
MEIDGGSIRSVSDFHDVFAAAFGFPEFYGRNGNAWIDCMTDLDDPEAGMTKVHVEPGKCLTLQIENAKAMKRDAPEIWDTLADHTAFVNWRRIEMGQGAVLALSYRD